MEMGSVKIAVGIDVDIINGILRHVYRESALSAPIDLNIFTENSTLPALQAQLEQPVAELKDVETTPRIGVRLTGEVSLFGAEPTIVTAWIEAIPQIVAGEEGEAPQAGIRLGAIEDVEPAWFESILQTLLTENVESVLETVTLPVFGGLIDQLEATFDEPPARDSWSAGFYIGKPSNIERPYIQAKQNADPVVTFVEHRNTLPCLLFTLALPGEDARLPGNRSIVTRGSGLQVMISESAMNSILAVKSAEQVGQEIEGATIDSLQLKMHPLGMEVHGKAHKDPADISWDGVLVLHWSRWYELDSGAMRTFPGGGRINVLTAGVDVDVDLPWWVTLLQVLLIGIGPIGWILYSILMAPALAEADEAPELVKGGLADAVGDAFSDMLGSLSSITGIAPVPMKLYGRDAWVLQGHYVYTSFLMAGYNEASFTDVIKDRFAVRGAEGESVGYFVLSTGHDVSPEEGGELMKEKILHVEGYHGVAAPWGYYVRSNRNQTVDDNLVALPDYP